MLDDITFNCFEYDMKSQSLAPPRCFNGGGGQKVKGKVAEVNNCEFSNGSEQVIQLY